MKTPHLIGIATSLLLIICTNAHGQFNIGLKGGLNYSNLKVKTEQIDIYTDHYSPSLSPNMGILGLYNISEEILIQGEILYSQKGFKCPSDEGIGRSNNGGNVKLNYLSIPIFCGYNFNKFSVLLGFEFSRLLSAFDKSDLGKEEVEPIIKNDFAIALGFQYNITDKVDLSIRYIHGLSSLYKPIINPELAVFRNRLIQLAIAYKFKNNASRVGKGESHP